MPAEVFVAFKSCTREEAQASASFSFFGMHSGRQVLQPPHEENRWIHACYRKEDPISEDRRIWGRGAGNTSHCAGLLLHVVAHRMKALAQAAIHSVHVSFPARLAHPSPGCCGRVILAGVATTADSRERKARRFQTGIMMALAAGLRAIQA